MTATPTATVEVPPLIGGGVEPGSHTVTGTGEPRPTPNGCIEICLSSTVGHPDNPPCPPGSVLGTGGTNSVGDFVSGGMLGIPLSQPLQANECIYAFDTCLDLVGPLACARNPAPVPALTPLAQVLATLMLTALGGLGIRRWRVKRRGS
jgi:hypothetical protein